MYFRRRQAVEIWLSVMLFVVALVVYDYTHYHGGSSMAKAMQRIRPVACQSEFGIGNDNVPAPDPQWSSYVGILTGPLTFQIDLTDLAGPSLGHLLMADCQGHPMHFRTRQALENMAKCQYVSCCCTGL